MTKRVAVIGATGSVGSSVLEVCRNHKDRIKVVALAAAKNAKKLEELSEEFGAEKLCLADKSAIAQSNMLLNVLHKSVKHAKSVMFGSDGLNEIANDHEIDHIVFASSGTDAIEALQTALKAGKEISLANKESIVVAGKWVMPLVQRHGQLRPLDSEHNAIWQCLCNENESVKPKKIYITASGGPFRDFSFESMKNATPEMALKHPVWKMGAKITIDSATLMNKGIELIEAMFLFGLEYHQVEALISPGSFVHGLVEFHDGFIKMLAGEPDMKLPAASCLFWPERLAPVKNSYFLNFDKNININFNLPDESRFPAIRIAKEAMKKGGAYPALLVGADEIAIDFFLKKEILFTSIPEVIEKTMESYSGSAPNSLPEALNILEWSKKRCTDICKKICK